MEDGVPARPATKSPQTGDGIDARRHIEENQLCQSLLIHHVRHLGDIAAVISFQHVDQTLHATPRHALDSDR